MYFGVMFEELYETFLIFMNRNGKSH